MPKERDLSKDIRDRIISTHKITEDLKIPVSTVECIVKKWNVENMPRASSPARFHNDAVG